MWRSEFNYTGAIERVTFRYPEDLKNSRIRVVAGIIRVIIVRDRTTTYLKTGRMLAPVFMCSNTYNMIFYYITDIVNTLWRRPNFNIDHELRKEQI